MGRKDKIVPHESSEMLPLGARLRYARQREGISLTQMAKDLGYTKSHLSAVENGVGRPSPELVERYERKLGLGLGELSRGDGDQAALERRHSPLNPAGVGAVREKDSRVTGVEKKGRAEGYAPMLPTRILTRGRIEDWGNAPSIRNFYGRESELADLKEWIANDHCRVVVLSGIGGVGKTALASTVARQLMQIEGEFHAVIWRSLQDTPSVQDILRDCIRSLSGQRHVNFPLRVEDQIVLLIEYLQRSRCLVVLDNFESVLQARSLSGEYQEGYQGYGELIERVGKAQHQSCLLLTSREKPKEVVQLEVAGLEVRSLLLTGVGENEGQQILKENGLRGSEEAFAELVKLYSGNPLALRLVTGPIRDMFGGDIDAFLSSSRSLEERERKEEVIIVGDISALLGQQFQRLTEQEQDIMYWLAIEREAVSPNDLQEDSLRLVSRGRLFQILEKLRDRSMIESIGNGRFTLQPAIMEYITENFINRVYEEIATEKIELLSSHVLLKAQTKDYVRSIQRRVVRVPLARRLLATFGKEETEKKLKNMLNLLREKRPHTSEYTAGNILNLLIELGCDLRGYDFSQLAVWQAYLQGANLPDVNFAYAELDKSVFTDTFERVLTARLSPNGMYLAAGTGNGDIRIWDASSDVPTPLHICRGHTDWVRSITFSSDGTKLVSGSDDETIRLWDVETGKCLQTMRESSRVFAVAMHCDGTILAAGNQDGTVRLWDLDTGQRLEEIKGHTYRVWSVAFSPDGKLLASGGGDSMVRLWDMKTGQLLQELKGHRHRVRSVAFSPDGGLLASGSKDHTVCIWSVKTGQPLHELKGIGNGVTSVAFSPRSRILACGSDEGTIRIWDVDAGRRVRTIEEHANWIRSVVFAPDGETIVTSSEDQTVRVWDVKTGQCLKLLQGHTEWVYAVAFSPNGKVIATGSGDLSVRLWDVDTGRSIRTLHGHTNWVRSAAFSPDGELLASGGEDQTVRLWKVSTGECLRRLEEHSGWVYAVAFSPDGGLLASGCEDHMVRLWKVGTGQLLQTLRGHSDWIRSIAFSPDGELLASGSEDQTVRLWKVSTGEFLRTLGSTAGRIYAVAFSPNGKAVATGSEDGIVKIWDVDSKMCLQTLLGHTGRVWSITFSPDGETIVSGSEDCTVQLWDIKTGQWLKTFTGFSNRVYSTAFSPDGSIIAGGSHDGTVKLWAVKTDALVQTLRSEGPYEGMNITGIMGLMTDQINMLKSLGAVEK